WRRWSASCPFLLSPLGPPPLLSPLTLDLLALPPPGRSVLVALPDATADGGPDAPRDGLLDDVGDWGPVRTAVGSFRLAPVRLAHDRSEEHTSELQSRENLVCRLL